MSKYKIITPNINYNGMTHNIQFENGMAIIEDENIKNILINDFKYKCELIEEVKEESEADLSESGELESADNGNIEKIDYNILSYPQLQEKAKSKGLKSVGISKEKLIKSLSKEGE